MPALAQGLTDPFQRSLHPFRLGFPPETEPSLPRGSAVMREPKEVEGFRPTLAASAAVRHGEPAELDATGLVRVECQTETGQPLPKIGQEALRVILMLESDHEIVGVADNHRFAACLLRAPLPVKPEVQDIVQVDVCQDSIWEPDDYGNLRRCEW